MQANRNIMVLGCSGAGKSVLARRVAEITGLRLIHMDYFYFEPNWTVRNEDDIVARVVESIAEDGWVFDGNHAETFDLRAEKSDVIIWVNIPRWRCLFNALCRTWRYRGETRPDMADDCPERMNWNHVKFIWNFKKRSGAMVKLIADNEHKKQIFILTNYRQVEDFVEGLMKESGFQR